MALATTDDLAARLPAGTIDDEDRAETLLAGASARVIAAAGGQQFARTTTTDRLLVAGRAVRLGQRPVHSVDAVTNTDGDDLSYTWHAGDLVYLDALNVAPVNAFELNSFRSSPIFVDVTYDHGYDTIPGVVVDIVCQVAARAYGSPATDGGITSETVDGYSYSRGLAAAVGVGQLFEEEKEILRQFRTPHAVLSMWPT